MIDKTAKNYLMKYTIIDEDNEKNKIALWPDTAIWLFLEDKLLRLTYKHRLCILCYLALNMFDDHEE